MQQMFDKESRNRHPDPLTDNQLGIDKCTAISKDETSPSLAFTCVVSTAGNL